MSRKHKRRDRVTGRYVESDFESVNSAALKEIDTLDDISDGWSGGTFTGAKGGSSVGYIYKTKCYHSGVHSFMTLDDVKVAGAQGMELSGWEADLIIDLAFNKVGEGDGQPFVCNKDKWKELEEFVHKKADVLKLRWADQGVPPVGAAFWRALWAKIKEGGYKRVCVCCVGGHGRTGTALASLLIVIGGYGDLDAVKFIRENYCEEAVESPAQDRYLEKLSKACGRVNKLESCLNPKGKEKGK